MSNQQKNNVVYPPRTYDLQSHRVWAPLIMWKYGSHEKVLLSNQKVIGFSHNIHATIAPVGLSCQDSHCYSSQDSKLGMYEFYHSLAIVNGATMRIDMQVFVLYTGFQFLRYIPRNRYLDHVVIWSSVFVFVFFFLRNFHTDFPNDWNNLHCDKQFIFKVNKSASNPSYILNLFSLPSCYISLDNLHIS